MVRIGIDLGGMSIKAGVVTEDGRILAKTKCPTAPERGHDIVMRDMARIALEAVAEAGMTLDDVERVGIGVPGIEDPARGIVPFLTNLGWHETPMRQLLQRDIDKPVAIANDATVAALAESVVGVSAGTRSSVFVTLGTGVGGGVIFDGKPFVGAHGVATEIGHMIIKFDGILCTCGHTGCLERYASASALIREGRALAAAHPDSLIATSVNGDPDAITAKTVIDAAKAGDPYASAYYKTYICCLCVGLGNLVNVYDPEILVIGGGVSAAGAFLLDAIRAELPKHIFYTTMPYARVELATLGNDAGIIGASML